MIKNRLLAWPVGPVVVAVLALGIGLLGMGWLGVEQLMVAGRWWQIGYGVICWGLGVALWFVFVFGGVIDSGILFDDEKSRK